jgi:hypothetical protein
MVKYYFNWSDLLVKSRKHNDSIIILTYALTFRYNYRIINNSRELIKKLNIFGISIQLSPYITFNRKTFEIFNNYEVNEPQSYFKNKNFLEWIISPSHKVQYIWALSHRKNDDDNDYIDSNIFTEKELSSLVNNPLIELRGEKLYFTPEENNR